MQQTPIATPTLVREDDLAQHVEDEDESVLRVNRIANGILVPCRWNDLTPDERRAANAVTFGLYE
jgi:hypothetical protein